MLLDLRKKIDIMSAEIIKSSRDSFDEEEIKTVLHNFFANG